MHVKIKTVYLYLILLALHWWLEEAKSLDIESHNNVCLLVAHRLIPFLLKELKVTKKQKKTNIESKPIDVALSLKKSSIPIPVIPPNPVISENSDSIVEPIERTDEVFESNSEAVENENEVTDSFIQQNEQNEVEFVSNPVENQNEGDLVLEALPNVENNFEENNSMSDQEIRNSPLPEANNISDADILNEVIFMYLYFDILLICLMRRFK